MPQFHAPRAADSSLRLVEVQAFLEEHGDALVNACELLGGGAARGRALELISTVAGASDLPRLVERELACMHRLLLAQEGPCRSTRVLRRPDTFTPRAPIPEEVGLLADAIFGLLRLLTDSEAGLS